MYGLNLYFRWVRMVIHVIGEIALFVSVSLSMHPEAVGHIFYECPAQPSPYKQECVKGQGKMFLSSQLNGVITAQSARK